MLNCIKNKHAATMAEYVGPYKISFIFSRILFYLFPNSVFSVLIFENSIFSVFICVNPDLLLLYYQKQCVFNVND